MTDEEKVYHPEEITDNPLPSEQTVDLGVSQPTTGGVTSAEKIADNRLPSKLIAHETIGASLNTKSRTILAEYTFTESGALQIGKYINGVSGDLRITPDGLTARDLAGIITFAIDGTTGDATFKGTIMAGSIITNSFYTGEITIGGADNESGLMSVLDETGVEKVRLDKDGIVVDGGKITVKDETDSVIIDSSGLNIGNFPSGIVSNNNALTTSSTIFVDMPDMILNFTLAKQSKVLIFAGASGGNLPNSGYAILVGLMLDNVQIASELILPGYQWSGGVLFMTGSTQTIETVATGAHTIKLMYKVNGGTGSISTNKKILGYVVLGK